MWRTGRRSFSFTVFLHIVFLFLLALPTTVGAQSQSTTGIIRGTVIGPDGAGIAGAAIRLRETLTNFERTVTSSGIGAFSATLLPLGIYDITVRAVGFTEVRQTGIRVRVGETVVLELQLGGAVALEAITVEARTPVVDVTRTEASTRLPEEAVSGLPNNGRDFINLTLLTPNVAIVQGPDGDELTIAGQRGIHNNISVDGADYNNPFFGEQRGGQRPPFTFNLDAVQEVVVIAGGANAEFGRSGGGFVNVITKSGTNTLSGSVHYFGKFDGISGDFNDFTRSDGTVFQGFKPDFNQHQFGFTLGGPIVRDRAFFFIAYDQQEFSETKQDGRLADPTFAPLVAWMDTAFGGALRGDFGPITRTDDARVLLAKFDFRLGQNHNLSLKYNYTWSEQSLGTFDVGTWARSANGLEKDFSHAVSGALTSFLSSSVSNEFRFQYARENRPRPYPGPTSAALGPDPTTRANRPFPDTAMDFANGFRFGMPFFLPIEYYDNRIQLLNNISISAGNHLFKFGAEWNRVNSVQTFIGFKNGRYIFGSVGGFLSFVGSDGDYEECDDGSSGSLGTCTAAGASPVGPVLLYLQQTGVGNINVDQAGTQQIPQHEIGVFLQDTWRVSRRLTLNYGLRWEAQIQPDPITPPSDVFYEPFIGQTVGGQTFPSDGTAPSDFKMFQPRLGFSYDLDGTGRTVLRAHGGLYYARIPGLNLASSRSTNGSLGQTLFRSSGTPFLGPVPAYDALLPQPSGTAIFPDVFVFDRDFRNPRTLNVTAEIERELPEGIAASISYTHARTDNLTRFINRNDAVFGSPWSTGLPGLPGNTNGIFTLTVVESSAKSRYNGVTIGLRRMQDPNVQFQINYTVSFDKSDDDNERDPFSFRYAQADRLEREYNWSDRDQRHRVNAWALIRLPGDISLNNRVTYTSAQPVSESCGPTAGNPFAPPAGARALAPADRICTDGSIIRRNTLRKDNDFFQWDIRITRPLDFGQAGMLELIVEVFNVTNRSNFLDPAFSLLFNFDGTVRSGLREPRQVQVAARWSF